MGKRSDAVEDIMDRLSDLGQAQKRVSVADVVEATGDRGFGPFIMIPALLEMTPIGGIPGVPTFLSLTIAIVAVQMLWGQDHLWLPGFIENRKVSGRKLDEAARKLCPTAKWFDNHFGGRLEWAADRFAVRLTAVVVLILCCTVPPLEFIPFASTVPMFSIAILGAALILRDGWITITGIAFAVVGLGAGLWWVSGRL